MPKTGFYIVIEGLDGSGKTTQFENLMNHLGTKTVGVREPGGTPMSESIRTLLKDKAIPRAAQTNMFLFSAARSDLIDTIVRPAVTNGMAVISDRNWLSTVAYQSAEGAVIEDIIQLSKLATGEFFEPDLLFLIDADPATCHTRLHNRGGADADFFESKGEEYFTIVREAYLRQAEHIRNSYIINGTPSSEQVWRQILTILTKKGISAD